MVLGLVWPLNCSVWCRVAAIHGDMDQHARMAVLSEFKKGTHHVLVATDVAARGLDIKCRPDLSPSPSSFSYRSSLCFMHSYTPDLIAAVSI